MKSFMDILLITCDNATAYHSFSAIPLHFLHFSKLFQELMCAEILRYWKEKSNCVYCSIRKKTPLALRSIELFLANNLLFWSSINWVRSTGLLKPSRPTYLKNWSY